MRIGEFAKKFGINASAVRFYIDKAIITPKRVNGLYVFDETCVAQMNKIMRYKKCRFSLEEIEVLCYYERTTKLKDEAVNKEYLQIFHDKESQIRAEIKEREEVIRILEEEIKDYRKKADASNTDEYMNIPVEALNILYCPLCGKKLPLRNADIGERGIVKGDLRCDCGYSTAVSEGMIVCEGSAEETPFKAFENIDSILAITDDFSPAYRNLIDKAHLWMYQSVAADKKPLKYVMIGPFSHNFMLKHIEELPEDPLYIIIDVSIKKIKKLQNYFAGTEKKILFVAGQMEELPIMKGSIDLYVDDFSSSNYTFTYSRNLFESISSLMKTDGMIVGLFIDYSLAPKSLENFKKDQENFNPELMKTSKVYETFRKAGLKIVEENNCGSTNGNRKDFTRNVIGEQVSVIAYYAKK